MKVSSYDNSDDALHSNGLISILGGTLNLAAADDGIHADSTLTIENTNLTVSESYEGIEGADITVNSGTINVTASDDGFNAAGGSDSQSSEQNTYFRPGDSSGSGNGQSTATTTTNFLLTINGGTIVVNAEGDGLDSNGSLYINGGDITVAGPSNGGNGALDSGDGSDCVISISGGILRAMAGTNDMVEVPSTGSQSYLYVTGSISAGTTITISDASGNVLDTFTAFKNTASLVYSSPSITSGSSYTVSFGNSSTSVTAGQGSTGEMGGGTAPGGSPSGSFGGNSGGPGGF